jgi:uncharacterized membrane protein
VVRTVMRRLLKIMHTLGAIGLMGAMMCLLVLLSITPAPSSLAEYSLMRGAMAAIAKWVFMPSLMLTLIAGLLAVAFNRAFHNAGWAWAKLLSGLLIFEYGLVGIQGPMQQEADQSALALTGSVDPSSLAATLGSERMSLWALLAVATANVVLGVWRPRFTNLPD